MNAPIRRRTRAREMALQFLYTLEFRGSLAMEELDAFIDHHAKRLQDPRGRQEVTDYTRVLLQGVQASLTELNTWIERIAANWRLERMAHLDRNVLRLALWELLYAPEVPFKVVINEAIELAKKFSTASSGSFVNGILDRARMLIEEQRAAGAVTFVPPDRMLALPREATSEALPDIPLPRPTRSGPPSTASGGDGEC